MVVTTKFWNNLGHNWISIWTNTFISCQSVIPCCIQLRNSSNKCNVKWSPVPVLSETYFRFARRYALRSPVWYALAIHEAPIDFFINIFITISKIKRTCNCSKMLLIYKKWKVDSRILSYASHGRFTSSFE